MVAENAPTERRAVLLAYVFYAQALVIACAALVSLFVVLAARSLDPEPSPRTVDQVWRWVMGLSLVLASFAMILRFNIPESPRFRMDVQDDLWRAFEETDRFRNTGLMNGQLDFELVQRAASGRNEEDQHNDQEPPNCIRDQPRPPQSRAQYFHELRDYFKTKGNWCHLLGTSIAWFMLDLGLYALSLSSPQMVSKLWYQGSDSLSDIKVWDAKFDVTDPDKQIYDILISNSWHALVVTSAGALIGGAGMIYYIRKINRRRVQILTFVALGVLFLITGPVYRVTVYTGYRGITIALYITCELLFYYGPNTLTFIFPVEIFPTQYRASCHGISAASGKLGSLVIQLILAFVKVKGKHSGAIDSVTNDTGSNWLGWVIMSFSGAMFIGAGATLGWIPDVQNVKNENFTLEENAVIRETTRRDAEAAELARRTEEEGEAPRSLNREEGITVAQDEQDGTAQSPLTIGSQQPRPRRRRLEEQYGAEQSSAQEQTVTAPRSTTNIRRIDRG
ncbi:hypothetical protein H2198_008403 [Neophaeococcomyces mojaviensis]|uniref:Uncharacterized protein n=1 Tax=Neophaeococcomyces mojaviensis TaxID=3383035 RepID=A0ACC2ZXB5_9EURO|nr:hypothetical protein H2198_008403 [Knufia sp. JES_112]